MALRYLLLAALVALALGCDRPEAVSTPSTVITPSTRPTQVPAEGKLTLATAADIAAAKQAAADPSINKAVMSYLGNSVQRWKISAARDVGGFTLLWIDFPGVADGGAFLVYDQETCHIRWEFKGGELG